MKKANKDNEDIFKSMEVKLEYLIKGQKNYLMRIKMLRMMILERSGGRKSKLESCITDC